MFAVFRLILAIPVIIFIASCAVWVMDVATASPENVNTQAVEASNKITDTGTKLIIDEATNPINIIDGILSQK